MDDNKDDVKHMIPEDDVINLHDLLAHSAPTKSPEEFERSTEDVELEADEKKVPVLGEEFISHHEVVAPSSSKRHTEVKIYEEGTYRYVVGRPNTSGPSTSSNYYGQIVNNVNTGQLRAVSSHDPSSSIAGRSQTTMPCEQRQTPLEDSQTSLPDPLLREYVDVEETTLGSDDVQQTAEDIGLPQEAVEEIPVLDEEKRRRLLESQSEYAKWLIYQAEQQSSDEEIENEEEHIEDSVPAEDNVKALEDEELEKEQKRLQKNREQRERNRKRKVTQDDAEKERQSVLSRERSRRYRAARDERKMKEIEARVGLTPEIKAEFKQKRLKAQKERLEFWKKEQEWDIRQQDANVSLEYIADEDGLEGTGTPYTVASKSDNS